MTSVVAKATVLSSAPSLPEPLFPVPFRRMVLPWEHPGTEKLRLETATLQTFSFMKRNKPDTILRKKKKRQAFFLEVSSASCLPPCPPSPCMGTRAFIIPSVRTEQHSAAARVRLFGGPDARGGQRTPKALGAPSGFSALYLFL